MTEHFTAGLLECMLQLIVSSKEWFIRPKGHVSFCLIRKRIAIELVKLRLISHLYNDLFLDSLTREHYYLCILCTHIMVSASLFTYNSTMHKMKNARHCFFYIVLFMFSQTRLFQCFTLIHFQERFAGIHLSLSDLSSSLSFPLLIGLLYLIR